MGRNLSGQMQSRTKKENKKTNQHECKFSELKNNNAIKHGNEVPEILCVEMRIIVMGRIIVMCRLIAENRIIVQRRNLVQSAGSRALRRQGPTRAHRAPCARRSLCSLRTSVVRTRVRGGV